MQEVAVYSNTENWFLTALKKDWTEAGMFCANLREFIFELLSWDQCDNLIVSLLKIFNFYLFH